MKKRIRILMSALVTLAMVVSLFGMAIPALASEITATKDVTDPFVPNIYYVGDTIYYEMTVENPVGNDETNTLTRIWDNLPDGTVIEFLAPAETLVQAPGDVDYFYAEYVVAETDLGWIVPPDPSIDPYWGVINVFEAEGYDTAADSVYAYVEKNSQVIQPCIDIQKTVDCNDDGEFLDEDYGIVGDTGHWRIVVTNCGEDDLFDVVVTDDNGHDFGAPFDLPFGGAPVEFNYDTVVNVDTTNWAYVTGYDDLGGAWSDEDGATNYVCLPDICIEKTVDCNDDGVFLDEDYGIVGDTGHWRIVVTNCGECDLFDVAVWDDNGHDFGAPFDLAAGDFVQFDYDTVVNADTTNVAYVEGYDAAGGAWSDEDGATNYVCLPDICIEKTVDCNDDGVFLDEDYGIVGDTGHWRIVVTNCGECDLFDVAVWDDNGHDFGAPFDLAAGDFVQFDYDTVVNADTTNVAYVEGYDAAGGAWSDEDGATNYVCLPDICIEKTVDCNDDGVFLDEDYGIVGDTGHWRIVVTNCGECDLFDVAVWDDNGHDFGAPFDLAAGDFVQFDYDTVVNADTTNVAYVEGYDAAGGAWSDEDGATNYVCLPDICIEKTVDCNDDGVFLDEDYGIVGDTGHWRIVVTNCGECDLFDVAVWDDNGHDFGAPFDLAAGDFVQFDYDTVVNADTTNVAYVEGYDAAGGAWSDEDGATNYVCLPDICIEKTVDCNDDGVFLDEDYGIVGDTGHWRIVVTNCGECDLFDVAVWDDNGHDFGAPFDLAAGDFVQFDYDTVVNADTTNVAYVEGYDAAGGAWSDEDGATNYVCLPDICIEKTVDCNDDGVFLDEDYGIVGDTGHWRIVVTNCGECDLFDVAVWDDNGHDFGAPFDLAAGDFVQFDYDTVVNADTTNVAYVEGYDAAGGAWSDEDGATNYVCLPDICIEKTVDCNDDGVFLDEDYGIVGDTGHWRIVVTNCGECDLFDVAVWDDNGHDFGAPFDLAAGDFVQFDYDTVVNADTTNVAYVEGYDAAGGAWSDEDGATNYVCLPDICIEKTVDCNDDGVFLDEDYGIVGDTGHWRIVVTNCGECDLFDVAVWDDNGHDFGAPFDLAAGDFVQFDYDTVVNADTTNVAYVEGYDAAGGAWSDEDGATNYVCLPDICIEKTVDCNDDGVFLDEDYGIVGDTGHWRIVVTNCGECDLFDVAVWDDNGHDFGAPFDLAAGDFVQFDYDTVVNADTTNVAYVEGYDAAGGAWSDEDGATNYVCLPDICIEKTVDCNDDGVFLDEDYGIVGDTGHWRIVVTNCGECDLFDVAVWDDNGHDFGAPFDLAAGDFVQFDYDTVVNADTTNVAYVEGYDAAGGAWSDEDGATNYVCLPDICIEKTVDCNDDGVFLDEDYGIVGDTGHWRIVVTNCGECDLFDVAVWDDNGHDFGAPFDLAAGDFVQFDYDTVVNADTTNVAYVEGYDAAGGAWSDEDGATNYVCLPDICIEKTVDCNDDGVFLDEDYGIVGDTGHWRIVVTNCGECDLFDVNVWDDNGHDFGAPFDLAAGDFVQFDYDTVVNADTTNVAYVEGYDAAGGAWSDEDGATNYVCLPDICIEKTVDCNDDGVFLDEDYGIVGDTGHWRIVVTNCGECDLFDVNVWDTNGMMWGPFDLAAGDFVQYDYDTIVNETTTNVAYVEGYDAAGGVWYDEDDATNVVTGGEGCTPGYWKNNAKNWGASAWVGYLPGDSFETVFGVDVTLNANGKKTYPTPTLLEALDANGGGINALARHAVAALLNISNPDIGYGIGSTAALITMVHDAIVSGDESQIEALHVLLADYNEAGCPLNQRGEPIIPDGGMPV